MMSWEVWAGSSSLPPGCLFLSSRDVPVPQLPKLESPVETLVGATSAEELLEAEAS